jgi:hypothetical protein
VEQFGRLILAGLPRSGTTLVATLLAAQPQIHFLTDYFPAFVEAQRRLGKAWNAPLDASERRIALALVRDQFLRVRHPVLVKLDAFASIDELHHRVLQELAAAGELWLGHKLLLSPAELRATLEQTDLRCLLLLRDPRDATLSFFYRTGGGVELYARTWRDTARLCRQLVGHPRLLALRFEDLIAEPDATLMRLGDWLGVGIDAQVGQLHFQRSRAHGATEWRENSAFQDVSGRFAREPVGRWKNQGDSLARDITRYAAWLTRHELTAFGYEPAGTISAREQARFACLQALERTERWAHDSVHGASRWLRGRLKGAGTQP